VKWFIKFTISLLALTLLCWAAYSHAHQYSNAPVAGSLSSPFGWRMDPITGSHRFHGGIDIAAPYGSSVYLPQDGVVAYSGPYGGYGNVVVVQHSGELYTLYGHNSYLFVKAGEQVHRGQVICLVGSTGRSTGPHLHFEVHQGNGYVNPLDYLTYLSGGEGYTNPLAMVRTPQSTSQQIAKVSPRSTRHKASKSRRSWSVEVIKGTDVEMVEF
jgi:murein DD-endopeptidase MepM/ murein hydrolase activator NlpD